MAFRQLFSTEIASAGNIKSRPKSVWYWAGFGIIITLFACFVYGSWIFDSNQFKPVSIPFESMSAQNILKIRIFETISLLVAIVTLWIYLVKPIMKTGKAPIEGWMLIATLIGYVFDTSINYTDYVMAWNVHSINLGTWGEHFPGHSGPVRYAEGLLWGPSMYMYFGLLLGLIQYNVIEDLKPKIGTLGAVNASFILAFLFDFIVESIIIRTTEVYAYPHIVPALTAFVGHQYQFPLYASFLVATYSTIYVLFIYSSKRSNESFVERGLSTIPVRFQFPIRFLAAVGFTALPIIIYFGGMFFFCQFAETTIVLPQYLKPSF
ncbi:spirocyclase AveC family protein [Roseimarinus sediminis]|uniref:spirocyclase AveC family protein n=1 Tax=Roseimarinus sediminis TaxID=1610899 RepID=UPI003D1E0468